MAAARRRREQNSAYRPTLPFFLALEAVALDMFLFPAKVVCFCLGLFVAMLACACLVLDIGHALVLLLTSAGFVLLGYYLHLLERARTKTPPPTATVRIRCPQCGDDDVVKALSISFFRSRFIGRCLNCGMRHRVTAQVWRHLPEADAGDPYETIQDRINLFRRASVSARRRAALVLVLVVATLLAWASSLIVDRIWPNPRANHFIFPFLVLINVAVRFWAWYFPPPRRPGRRCTQCGYDLRACTEPRCPECATPFDPAIVRAMANKTPQPDTSADEQP